MNDEEPAMPSKSWEDLESEFMSTLWGRTALGSSELMAGPGRQYRAVSTWSSAPTWWKREL